MATRFDAWRPGDQRYYVSNTTRFRTATGWAPRIGVAEGLDRLTRWLRASLDDQRAASGAWAMRAS
jgi:CDP-paratose 2-epimerase